MSPSIINEAGVVEYSETVLRNVGGRAWSGFPDEKPARNLWELETWMRANPSFGWIADNLRESCQTNIVFHLTTQFWVPDSRYDVRGMVVVHSELVLRRDSKSPHWEVFRPLTGEQTVENLLVWLRHAPGWNPKLLLQVPGGDGHLWRHNGTETFYTPKTNRPVLGRAVCVNTLGCETLTMGKVYELKNWKDDLVTTVDDEGKEREFLPERFTRGGVSA